MVRYADDLVVCAFSKEHAEQVKTRLAEWLAPRGLVFNEDKTKIVHLTEGFDFLGFNIRRYRNGKLLITPSPAAVERLRKRLAAEMRALRGSNAAAVIAALNPIIRGWAAYYRGVVSSKIFGELDSYVWKLTYRWAKRTHGGKPKRWIIRRYFGRFDRFRGDNWVFGNRAGIDDRGNVPPGQIRLDRHRPAPVGHGYGVPGRPGSDRLLGATEATSQTPAGQLQPAPAHQAGRPLSALRMPSAHRRPATAIPTGVGTLVAERRPQGPRCRLSRPPK